MRARARARVRVRGEGTDAVRLLFFHKKSVKNFHKKFFEKVLKIV